jgi:hypothetical protein
MSIAPPLDQQWMMINEGLAHSGLERKGITGNPRLANVESMTPYWVLKIHNQTMAEETTGTIDGTKKIARKNERPTNLVFSRLASRKATIVPRGTARRT